MAIIIKAGIFCINVLYFFMKLLPTKNKVTMMSRQSSHETMDFRLLREEIERRNENVKVVVLCKELKDGIKSTIIDKIKYIFHMLVQMYHLATSKVVILDSYCMVVSILKHKKELKIIQMWHSMGTMKLFGYAVLDKEEGSKSSIAKLMKMHKNYDYIFASNEAYKDHLARGFNYTKDNILTFPLPRLDLLISKEYDNEQKEKIYEVYPGLKSKKNIVYCPTFRKNEDEFAIKVKELIDNVDLEKYNLIIKLHPLSKVNELEVKDGVYFDKKFSSFDMLCVANYLISDYSCIIYEAAIKNIPLYFYNFDMDHYEVGRGLAIDYYKELPGPINKDAKELLNSIENKEYDMIKLKKFKDKYVYDTKHASKDIIDFVWKFIK